MDNKTFINHFAKLAGIDNKDASVFVENLAETLQSILSSGDSVAIPGFGHFNTIKSDEKIINDLSTGKRLLLPPVIETEFTPASALTKKITNQN